MTLAPRRTRRRPAPVVSLKPDRLVWRTALRLAKGDAARLQVLSPTEVLVLRNSDATHLRNR